MSLDSIANTNCSIRNAIDDKVTPNIVRNLDYLTAFIFLLLLGISIGYYVSSKILYENIKNDIFGIKLSETRIIELFEIGICTKSLLLVDPRFHKANFSRYNININDVDDTAIIYEASFSISRSAKNLKSSQSQLNLDMYNKKSEDIRKINPNYVTTKVIFSSYEIPLYYTYDTWQVTLELLTAALRISNETISQRYTNYSSIYFINENLLNSILISFDYSTEKLVDLIEDSRQKYLYIYLVMVIIASVAVVVSTAVLIPVLKYVKDSKGKALSFFLLLEEKEIDEYKFRCKKFCDENKLVYLLETNRYVKTLRLL